MHFITISILNNRIEIAFRATGGVSENKTTAELKGHVV